MDVFVYGTLTEPARVDAVVDAYAFLGPAVLSGLHPVQGAYPTLAPGGETGGRLLRTDEVDALDAYEGVDDGLYVRVAVPIEHADAGGRDLDATAAVYVGDPGRLDAADAVTWPEPADDPSTAAGFAARVRAYVSDRDVRVRPK